MLFYSSLKVSEIQTGIFARMERAVTKLRNTDHSIKFFSRISKESLNEMKISRKEILKLLGTLGVKLYNVEVIAIQLQSTSGDFIRYWRFSEM